MLKFVSGFGSRTVIFCNQNKVEFSFFNHSRERAASISNAKRFIAVKKLQQKAIEIFLLTRFYWSTFFCCVLTAVLKNLFR